jgi:hypothetical protein
MKAAAAAAQAAAQQLIKDSARGCSSQASSQGEELAGMLPQRSLL